MPATPTPPPTPSAPDAGLPLSSPAQWKKIALLVGVVALAGLAWIVWREVREGKREGRWEDLWRAQGGAAGAADADMGGRDWLFAQGRGEDLADRDAAIARLEEFLGKHEDDPLVAAHVHSLIFNLQQTQILAVSPSAKADDLKRRYDSAEAHLRAIVDKYPDFPLNWEAFKPEGFASISKMLLAKLGENRAWQEKHGLTAVEPDPDVVVLLRTTKGDLRVRLYGTLAHDLATSFADRACRGAWDGTGFFTKIDETDRKFLRAGDARTRAATASDDDRLLWGDPTPDELVPFADARHRVLHQRGTLSAWHDRDDQDDDPSQFLVVVADSPELDYQYTPFGRVEDASLPTLDRILSVQSRRQEKPEIAADAKYSRLQDQLVRPVVVVKALVYDKGELRACHDAAKVRESERKLATVVLDEDRIPDPPPAPPATPPAPAGGSEPAMDAPMDGSGK